MTTTCELRPDGLWDDVTAPLRAYAQLLDDDRRRRQVLYPIVPPDGRGMPAPGPEFLAHAEQALAAAVDPSWLARHGREDYRVQYAGQGKQRAVEPAHPGLLWMIQRCLYLPGAVLPVSVKQRRDTAAVVPGHLWGRPLGRDGEGRLVWPEVEIYGPNPADVMVIGQHPGHDEEAQMRNFVGPTSDQLYLALEDAGIPPDVWSQWYICNVIRHRNIDPGRKGQLPKDWLRNSLHLLHQEIRLIKPQYILCLGGEAVHGLLGSPHNVTNTEGRALPYAYWAPVACTAQDEPDPSRWEWEERTATVLTAPHPAFVHREPVAFRTLSDGLRRFDDAVAGHVIHDVEATRDHRVLTTVRQVRQVVDEILDSGGRTADDPIAIAWDLEWHGKHWEDGNAYARTIQFAHAYQKAFLIPLARPGGAPYAKPGNDAIVRELRRLLEGRRDGREGRAGRHRPRHVRHGGHFFKADIPRALYHLGLDFRQAWRPPGFRGDEPEHDWADPRQPWMRTKYEGGWDTGLMAHAIVETGDTKESKKYKLEILATRYTSCPRYDAELQKWRAAEIKRLRLKDEELDGYGECPDGVLFPYALYDACATWRLFHLFNNVGGRDEEGRPCGMLDRDPQRGLNGRKAFWINMAAQPAFMEMEGNGVLVDRDRGQAMVELFQEARDQLVRDLRAELRWPEFNLNSVFHVREALFKPALNGKLNKHGADPVSVRPPGAVSLNLRPIKASGTDTPWYRVREPGLADFPSTDKESLGILANDLQIPEADRDLVRKVRNAKFVNQVLKTQLRPPRVDKAGDYIRINISRRSPEYDDWDAHDGDLDYDGGLMHYCDEDGRVRSRFYPIETGRCSSSAPNLQNLAKRREDDYRRIIAGDPTRGIVGVLGPDSYRWPIRSMIRARPGHVLIEADYKSAELLGMAIMANDPSMIAAVKRNLLDEHDPDYLDLHSEMAMRAFDTDTPQNRELLDRFNREKRARDVDWRDVLWGPTKDLLAALGMPGLRVAAKNVNFGVPYQRGSAAIARQCREEGALVTDVQAQMLIDMYFTQYPLTAPFLEDCKGRVLNPGWMMGAFGRLRRFPYTTDATILANIQREACNFPIQNLVGDAMSHAMYHLMNYRRAHGGPGRWFYPLLQIHDALLLEVPFDAIDWVVQEVLPTCMCRMVPLWPRDLDGKDRLTAEPYHFGIDTEVALNWGQKLYEGDPGADQVPAAYVKKRKAA